MDGGLIMVVMRLNKFSGRMLTVDFAARCGQYVRTPALDLFLAAISRT